MKNTQEQQENDFKNKDEWNIQINKKDFTRLIKEIKKDLKKLNKSNALKK